MPAHQVKLWSDNNFAIEHYSFVMLSHFAAAESRKTRHARPCAGHPRLSLRGREDVDGRDKPGHDGRGCVASTTPWLTWHPTSFQCRRRAATIAAGLPVPLR